MKELDHHKLVVNKRVARKKICNLKEEQEHFERKLPIYANDLRERIITPETYVSCMQMSTKNELKSKKK